MEKVTEETLRDWNHFNELVSICEGKSSNSGLPYNINLLG